MHDISQGNGRGATMVKVLNRRTFKAGDLIFREGDAGTNAYVVQSGRVRIEKEKPGSPAIVLGHVDTGGIFGEMSLIDNSRRMATAKAEGATVLISIPKEVVKQKLSKADPIVRMLILMMIRMIRTVAEHGGLGKNLVEEFARAAEDDAPPTQSRKTAGRQG